MLSCSVVSAWTVAHQVPLSMEFSRQEYWSGLPFPLQGIFFIQGLNLHWQEDSLPPSQQGSPGGAFTLTELFFFFPVSGF